MAEYIEREALLKWFEPYLCAGETWVEIHPVLDVVHTLPAADVAPVVHGEWEMGERSISKMLCSNCRCTDKEKRPFYKNIWDYCPNCGARMDGE